MKKRREKEGWGEWSEWRLEWGEWGQRGTARKSVQGRSEAVWAEEEEEKGRRGMGQGMGQGSSPPPLVVGTALGSLNLLS